METRARPSGELDSAPMIEGEPATTAYADDAETWIAVYNELLRFAERLPREGAREAGRGVALERYIRRLSARLAYWRQRWLELGGYELDLKRRRLRFGVATIGLTTREAELLEFLSRHPGRPFTAEQLLLQAWHSSALTAEQLRTYIGRLRRKLAELGMSWEVTHQYGVGYTLVVR